ncbi:DNA polymerase IV [Alkalilimnicola ehrlichii]|nr:DNA polymerase IV [Alkalilimnicola ehrlichii]
MRRTRHPAMSQRKIIHVDMDAFYASVEQRDRPGLRGRPVVVGGDPNGRGVVAAASYEARRHGIHSAMPAWRAARLCPDAVFLRPRFDVYRSISAQIQALFREYTPLVEPLSLDEAYLDVSDCPRRGGSATLIAREIRARIHEQTGLTASAGVSCNKFLAKIASDLDKPDGLHVIPPEQAEAFVAALPVGKIHGVGQATRQRMERMGVRTGADLRRLTLLELQRAFGSRARFYYELARGRDERPVRPRRERKSVGAETTFGEDLNNPAEMLERMAPLADKVAASLHRRGLAGRTVTLKVKYHDFRQITRSLSGRPVQSADEIRARLPALLQDTEAGDRPVRLLGVTVSGLVTVTPDQARQLALF